VEIRPPIPKWKYWLSYLTEIHVESCPSKINPHMYVSLSKGRVQLSTENAVYSYEDRYDNFRLLFDKIDLGSLTFENALLLGLGLGSVPLLIEKNGLQLDEMALVEIDENVIYLAQKYTLDFLKTKFTTYCVDASVFVQSHQRKYDLIISDIFLDDEIPDYFLTTDYLHALKRLQTRNGLIIMNTLASTSADKEKSGAYFEKVFKTVFPEAIKMHVWENYMLLSRKL